VRGPAASRHVGVAFDAGLGDTPELAWRTEIRPTSLSRQLKVIEEVVFPHCPSATPVFADPIENFEAAKRGMAMRWTARLGGVLDPSGKAPLDMRFTFRDRASARACLQHSMCLAAATGDSLAGPLLSGARQGGVASRVPLAVLISSRSWNNPFPP